MQSSEIWDQEQLRTSLGVMKQIMPKLVNTFLGQTTSVLETLNNQSDSQLMLTAHSLKGSAGQLCCKRLANISAKIEHELKLQIMENVDAKRAALIDELMAARQLMSEYIQQNEPTA